jgi:hypothetical protein
MAYVEKISGTSGPADVVCTAVGAILHRLSGIRFRRRDGLPHPSGPLDASMIHDFGAHREYQDYAPSGIVSRCSERRLHHIADITRCTSPR